MDVLQIIVLAFVQGVTEFLPISSSAHLILVPVLTGWQDQGLGFDLATHVGTLAAVLIYFRKEWPSMLTEGFAAIPKRALTPDARLGWAVVVGTVPVGLAGLVFKDYIQFSLRSPYVISATTIIFGIALGLAYAKGRRSRDERSLTLSDALGVGEPGKELEAPMAIVILGGLITSTFLNMVVVPSLYARFGKQLAPA